MAEAQAKIVFDADAAKIIAEALRAQGAVKKVGTEAKGVGKELGQWGGQLAKSVVGVGALVRGIAAATKEMQAFARANAEANRAGGAAALTRGQAAGKLGITAADADAATAAGRKSRDERTSFLSTLAQGGELDRGTVFQAAELFGSGLFTESEVAEAARAGRLSDLRQQIPKREAGLGQAGMAELDQRVIENQARDEIDQTKAARGVRQRDFEMARDLRNARSPVAGALQNVVGGALSPIGGDAAVEIGDRALRILVGIENNTARRPSVAPAVGKD